jgi:hypothetical protein
MVNVPKLRKARRVEGIPKKKNETPHPITIDRKRRPIPINIFLGIDEKKSLILLFSNT